MKKNETMMNNAIKYINSIVITINPGINAPTVYQKNIYVRRGVMKSMMIPKTNRTYQ